MLKFPDKKKTEPEKAKPAFFVEVDKMAAVSSRRACTESAVSMVREICEKLNIVLPREFWVIPELFGSPEDPNLRIGFHLAFKVHPFHEWMYFALLKLPVIGKYVRGPRINVFLMPSERDIASQRVVPETVGDET